jgi:hypothetical protein
MGKTLFVKGYDNAVSDGVCLYHAPFKSRDFRSGTNYLDIHLKF